METEKFGEIPYSEVKIAAREGQRNKLFINYVLKDVHRRYRDSDSVYNQTILHLIAAEGLINSAKRVIKLGADINAQDDLGRTPLFEAVKCNKDNMVQFLLKAGADANIPNRDGVIPLQIALLSPRGCLSTIELLSNKLPNVIGRLQLDMGHLHVYLESKYAMLTDTVKICRDVVEFLFNQKINLNLPCTSYSPLLHFVIRRGDDKIFKLVMDRSMLVSDNAENLDRDKLFGSQSFEMIKMLSSHGIDENSKVISYFKPPLEMVWNKIKYGHRKNSQDIDISIMRILLDHGADACISLSNNKSLINNAITDSHWNVVRLLLNYGAQIEWSQSKEITDMVESAIHSEDFDFIKLLSNSSGIKDQSEHLVRMLFNSRCDDKYKMMKVFVDCGVDINVALPISIEGQHYLMSKFLIELGADVNLRDEFGYTPFNLAWRKLIFMSRTRIYDARYQDLLKLNETFLRYEAEIDNPIKCDNYVTSPLHRALLLESIKPIQFLLDKRYNTKFSREFKTVSVEKVEECREVVEYLLNQNFDFVEKSSGYSTLLHFAIVHGDDETCSLVLPKCKNLNIDALYDKKGILHMFVEKRREDMVKKVVIEYSANILMKEGSGRTPLHLAVRENVPTIVRFLINQGAEINVQDKYGYTPLHFATCIENYEILEMLLNKKADVNVESKSNSLPIHLVCGFHRPEEVLGLAYQFSLGPRAKEVFIFKKHMAKLLIDNGADINATGYSQRTPLGEACRAGNLDAVLFLLENGADVEKPGHNEKTPLLEACAGPNSDVVYLLLKFGVDIHKTDVFNNTALHFASATCKVDVAELLLRKGLQIDVHNQQGWTPLLKMLNDDVSDNTCNEDIWSMLELLVDYGARVNIHRFPNQSGPFSDINLRMAQYIQYILAIKVDLKNVKYKLKGDNQIARTLVAYSALKEQLKLQTSKDWDVNGYFNECKLELKKLKKRVVETCKVSFYDFLVDDFIELALFTENDKVMAVLESGEYKKEFPCYGLILEWQILRIKELAEFMKKATVFLEESSKLNLPDLVLIKIFSYLGVEGCRRLMRALEDNTNNRRKIAIRVRNLPSKLKYTGKVLQIKKMSTSWKYYQWMKNGSTIFSTSFFFICNKLMSWCAIWRN